MADANMSEEVPSTPQDDATTDPMHEPPFDTVQLTPAVSDTTQDTPATLTEVSMAAANADEERSTTAKMAGGEPSATDTQVQDSTTGGITREGSSTEAAESTVTLPDGESSSESRGTTSENVSEEQTDATDTTDGSDADGRNRGGSGRSDGDKSDSGSADGRGSSPISPARKKETGASKSRFQSLRSLRDRYNAAKEAVQTVPDKQNSMDNTHVIVKSNPGSLDIKVW